MESAVQSTLYPDHFWIINALQISFLSHSLFCIFYFNMGISTLLSWSWVGIRIADQPWPYHHPLSWLLLEISAFLYIAFFILHILLWYGDRCIAQLVMGWKPLCRTPYILIFSGLSTHLRFLFIAFFILHNYSTIILALHSSVGHGLEYMHCLTLSNTCSGRF